MFTFSIEKWRAWAPALQHEDDWRVWARDPHIPTAPDALAPLPDTTFLPPLQRRRLSPLARMVFDCAWPLAENLGPMPIVFASRHGETSRSFTLLHTLATGEPLSPTSFGLSVHNAIVGQWSILRKEATEGVALAGEADMLEHAFIEAAALLRNGTQHVLVVAAEECPPPHYAPWIDDVPFSYAVAFRLGNSPEWSLKLEHGAQAEKTATLHTWPHPLSLLCHLLQETPAWRHEHAQRSWYWNRLPL